jgi:hypothetical protein
MKEGRDLVKEAIADAKSLKEAAVEAAQKQLVEQLTPAVRKLLDESIKGNLHERDRTGPSEWDKSPEGGTRQQKKDYGKVEESPDLTLEDALQEFFPAGGLEEKKMKSEKDKKKGHSSTNEAAEADSTKSSMSEEIEISESELRKVYEAALQTEVQVKKGFSDIVGGGELEQAHKEHGIEKAPVTKHFEEADVPHKQKWIPEAKQLHGMLQKGLAENKALRENLRKAVTMIETLGKKLHEVNLFNAKVLHVNKILNSGARLTAEQKNFVMESIDKARSIGEVRMVFETIVGSIKTGQAAINENRNARPPKANAARPRTTGTPNQSVLSESVDRQGQAGGFNRIKELAGLLK